MQCNFKHKLKRKQKIHHSPIQLSIKKKNYKIYHYRNIVIIFVTAFVDRSRPINVFLGLTHVAVVEIF